MKKLQIVSIDSTDAEKDAALRVLGWNPEPWQEVEMHKMRKRSEYYLSVARQNGKSYNSMWISIEFSLFYGYSGAITVHTDKLKQKLLREMSAFLATAKQAGLVDKVLKGDAASVHFTNGAICHFVIRNDGFLTGLTLDYLHHDEAQKAFDWIEDEANPAMNVSELAFVSYVGTPQTLADYQKYGMNKFQKALEANHPDMSIYAAYDSYREGLEFNWAALAKSNPSWRRVPENKKKMKRYYARTSEELFWTYYGGVPNRRSDKTERQPPRFTGKEVDGFLTRKASIANNFIVSIGITAESDTAYAAMTDGKFTEIGHRWDVGRGQLHAMAEDLFSQAKIFKQIRISGTPRGKALADILKERGLGAKIKVMSVPETSSNLDLMISQLEKSQLKVVDVDPKQETRTALSSFWIELNPRSGGGLPVSELKTDEALIVALSNSALDQKSSEIMNRLQRYGGASQSNDKATTTVPVRRRGGVW